jgi:DNA-directed RNA polymerase subunit RPC12/RpoP
VRNKAEERIAQSKCIECGEPLHKWDVEGEEIACTDCRDNKFSAGGG